MAWGILTKPSIALYLQRLEVAIIRKENILKQSYQGHYFYGLDFMSRILRAAVTKM